MQDGSSRGLQLPAVDDSLFQVYKIANEDADGILSASFLLA